MVAADQFAFRFGEVEGGAVALGEHAGIEEDGGDRHLQQVPGAFLLLGDDLEEWLDESPLMKRTFAQCAQISGLIARRLPGKEKTGRQVTFSTDLIYDVLRKYEPDHLLLEAAWADARTRLTDVGRLGDLLDRSAEQLVHVELDRVGPLAVPVMVMIGREATPQGSVDDELLLELSSRNPPSVGN